MPIEPALTTGRIDWGPYRPWTWPLVLLARGRRQEAALALRQAPDPPGDLLLEALWCLTAQAAIAVGDREIMERAHSALARPPGNWQARAAACSRSARRPGTWTIWPRPGTVTDQCPDGNILSAN